jgi:hypothetical protein
MGASNIITLRHGKYFISYVQIFAILLKLQTILLILPLYVNARLNLTQSIYLRRHYNQVKRIHFYALAHG